MLFEWINILNQSNTSPFIVTIRVFWIIRVVWIYEEYCIVLFLSRMNVILRTLWTFSASTLVPTWLDVNFTHLFITLTTWRLQDRTIVGEKWIHVFVILLSSGAKPFSRVRISDLRVRKFWPNKPKANNIIPSQDLSVLKEGHDADTSVSKFGILKLIRNEFVCPDSLIQSSNLSLTIIYRHL
jgi:hypothetical protein